MMMICNAPNIILECFRHVSIGQTSHTAREFGDMLRGAIMLTGEDDNILQFLCEGDNSPTLSLVEYLEQLHSHVECWMICYFLSVQQRMTRLRAQVTPVTPHTPARTLPAGEPYWG